MQLKFSYLDRKIVHFIHLRVRTFLLSVESAAH